MIYRTLRHEGPYSRFRSFLESTPRTRALQHCGRSVIRLLALALVALGTTSPDAVAGGPHHVTRTGAPWRWAEMPIRFHPDRGDLGRIDNATALRLVDEAFAVWTSVPTASISVQSAGSLPEDVTVRNYRRYWDVCGDGLTPIIFDHDGHIIDAIVGPVRGARLRGLTSRCAVYATGEIREGAIVINGRYYSGLTRDALSTDAIEDLRELLVHEIGHLLGLAHAQTNAVDAAGRLDPNAPDLPMMFALPHRGRITKLHLDDEAALSVLYPSPSFSTTRGAIAGRVLAHDGQSAQAGVHVVARDLLDPRVNAAGALSGAYFWPTAPGDGTPPAALEAHYEIAGLPPGLYTLHIEPIAPAFHGPAALGHFDPPPALSGPAEAWNGDGESAHDDPTIALPVLVLPGVTTDGIDFVANAVE